MKTGAQVTGNVADAPVVEKAGEAKLNRTITIFLGVFALLIATWWFLLRGDGGASSGYVYRTEKVTQGDVTLSFNATGVLQPLTVVDVKSKAGGTITKLAVDEGSEVNMGDLIAEIDPRDTRALFDQATSDLSANVARKQQNQDELAMQQVQSREAVASAQASLRSAQLRANNFSERAKVQPTVTAAAIDQAQTNNDIAIRALDTLRNVTQPQERSQAKGELDRAKADLSAAKQNQDRQEKLVNLGYAAASALEQARSQYQSALAAYDNAQERQNRIENDFRIQIETAQLKVKQTKAALDQANSGKIDVQISQRDLQDAQEAVKQAQASLKQAQSNLRQIDVRRSAVLAANAAIVRSRVSQNNAKVQLDSTTVLAPRSGVVVKKYLEEGTIIPPGTSTFAQGTSIVQIADTSTMYVECLVDEADVGRVHRDQNVRVTLEAYPRSPILGRVSRINPAADTANGVTQVKVRIEIQPNRRIKLMPGLNASCEFIENEVTNVLMVPLQALQREGKNTFVEVMVGKDKTVRKAVKTGLVGNTMAQVTEGLKDGEEVVTTKIDLKQIAEQEKKMQDMQNNKSPFSGGGMGGGGRGMGGGGGRRGGGAGK